MRIDVLPGILTAIHQMDESGVNVIWPLEAGALEGEADAAVGAREGEAAGGVRLRGYGHVAATPETQICPALLVVSLVGEDTTRCNRSSLPCSGVVQSFYGVE